MKLSIQCCRFQILSIKLQKISFNTIINENTELCMYIDNEILLYNTGCIYRKNEISHAQRKCLPSF